MSAKVAVVTGASSGIGKDAAKRFADNGYVVYGISRTGRDENGVIHISADVTKPETLESAYKRVFDEQQRLDVLVNDAGMGISGAIEFTELADARRIFDVNFFGTFCSIKAALPYLRKTDGARIINLSSVAAPVAIPFQAFYSATKAGINSLTMALANELKPAGIKVSAVMPGDVRTGFTDARVKNESGAELYGEKIKQAVGAMEKDERGGMEPGVVGELIYRIAQKKNPKVLYTAGGKYKFFVLLTKLLPANVYNKIVGAMY